MADVMSKEQRSRCMSSIKSKNTKPEILVRKFLFGKGLRYRVNNRKLPGTPDIVLPKYHTVIFIDGCFWHGHTGCKYFRMPSSNVDFWRTKIAKNINRDKANRDLLRASGWRVIQIWECELRKKTYQSGRLEHLYQSIVNPYNAFTEYEYPVATASEPETPYH